MPGNSDTCERNSPWFTEIDLTAPLTSRKILLALRSRTIPCTKTDRSSVARRIGEPFDGEVTEVILTGGGKTMIGMGPAAMAKARTVGRGERGVARICVGRK